MSFLGLPDHIPHFLLERLDAGNCPAIPLGTADGLLDTLAKLANRATRVTAAVGGLTTPYTIGGTTAVAAEFLFGASDISATTSVGPVSARPTAGAAASSGPLDLPLESADQWAIAWTNYAGVHERAVADGSLRRFGAALYPGDPAAASEAFWPTVATYGVAINPLVIRKLDPAGLAEAKAVFGAVWTDAWDEPAAGPLYAIDHRLFEQMGPDDKNRRFTPATYTLLQQDSATKALRPVAVRVSGPKGAGAQLYVEASPAWLYALQAARTSVMVFGIWLGHVFPWHVISAAMLMTMQQTLPETHPVRRMLDPQSRYLSSFDLLLLLNWDQIAPPTSVNGPEAFLKLMSQYATNRGYFMDDLPDTLQRLNIARADFTAAADWDQFPVIGTYTAVWDATATYVGAVVDAHYSPASPPADDTQLQAWMAAAGDPSNGNVAGLPRTIDTADRLKSVLTSLVYRLTVHGASRLLSSSMPGLAYVANAPPCLLRADIRPPQDALTPSELFKYLPTTRTIGGMVKFLYTFAFSEPYEPFVPFDGLESPPDPSAGAADPALLAFRRAIENLIDRISPAPVPHLPQRYQWPLCIET